MPHEDEVPNRSPDDLVRSLEAQGIEDPRVLDAFRDVRRGLFVRGEDVDEAYEDEPLPIGHEQVTTQPSLIARMVEALELRGGERVLEVGTGLGFQTAILARLCREVFSIERFEDLAARASRNLRAAGIANVFVFVSDGTLGLPEHAPYDAIVIAAAAPEVPRPLVEQLAEGGRLVHPLGPSGDERVTAYRKQDGELQVSRRVAHAYFVPLIGAHGVERLARGVKHGKPG